MGPNPSCPQGGGPFDRAQPQYCEFDIGGTPYRGLCDPTDGHVSCHVASQLAPLGQGGGRSERRRQER